MVDQGKLLLENQNSDLTVADQRRCHLQAFQLFAIAMDVDTGFSDKAMELTGHAFTLSPFVFRRLDGLLADVAQYVETGKTTRWYTRVSQKHSGVRLSCRPTVMTKNHLFIICDRPTTTSLTDVAEIGMCLALSGRDVAFVSNVHTGELVQVRLPASRVDFFITQAIASKLDREETLNDEDFKTRFELLPEIVESVVLVDE
jgi:hypothetical protein